LTPEYQLKNAEDPARQQAHKGISATVEFPFFGYRRACVERRLNLAQTEEEDMDDLKTLETKLNALIAKGEMIEAVTLTTASTKRKTVKTVNALTLHGQSIGDGITMSEWTFNLTTNNGPILWNEVLRRRWQNGKVASERYYTAP
jgi:hypothetical protein